MLDDDEKFLETLIDAGRTGPGPDAQQVERMERRLEPAFLSARAFVSNTPRVHAAKWILAVIGIGVLSAASDMRELTNARDESQSVAVRAEAQPVATPIAVPPETPQPALRAPEPEPVPTTERIVDPTKLPDAPPKSVSAKTLAKISAVNPMPEASADIEPPTPAKVEEAVPPSAPEAPASIPSARSPSGESEASFLRRAQSSLNSNPTRALALADEHPSRFPDGVLAQEREVIAIDALVKLHRTAEARTRAAAFRSRYPSSAHLGRVLSAVGDMP